MRFIKPLIKFKISMIAVLSISASALAYEEYIQTTDFEQKKVESIGTEYFTISEKENDQIPMDTFEPMTVVNDLMADLYAKNPTAPTKIVDLLNWVKHDANKPEVPAKYQRAFHFGSWIKDPTKTTCFNTRARVLIRDADGKFELKETNKCAISKGVWHDPYTDEIFTDSEDVQIDHLVPLKNAYVAGAWKWNFSRRCNYANFLGNDFNLIAVSGHENMSKGDNAPDEYLPPNKAFRCQYLEKWLKVKAIWKLKLSRNEAKAINDEIKALNCDSSTFIIPKAELRKQRQLTDDIPESCIKENRENSAPEIE